MATSIPSKKLLHVPVLIIGAGPVGLTLSLLLSKYGIRSHIIEKETEIIDHPRAHFINTRTMEIFRSLGIDHEVYDRVRPLHEWRKFKYCTSVLGDENVVDIGETDHFSSDFYFQDVDDNNNNKKNLYTELKKNSPSPVANLSQAKLTKILYNNVKENNNVNNNNNNTDDNYDKQLGTIDMGMEVESISFDNNNNNNTSSNTKMNNDHSIINVISRVNNNNNNDKTDGNNNNEKQRAIQCNYLIGADGAGSMVRQALNIELNGIPNMQYLINVHFHCPKLSQYLENRHAMLYFVFNHKTIAVFIAHDIEEGDWVVQIPYFPPQQQPSDFDEEKCLAILKNALLCDDNNNNDKIICKFEDLSVDIKSIKPWTMSGLVAETFMKNNMLLIGDAAHQFPPSGGFGMNTGIQDAHNLAWKLSKTLKYNNGESSSSSSSCSIDKRTSESNKRKHYNNVLLESYETERKPIAEANNKLSIYNFESAMRIPKALGLSPSHANLVSKTLASTPISRLPQSMQRSLLDNIMSLGLKQLHITGPNNSNLIAKECKKRVQDILTNGRGLHLLFPAYEIGFQYNDGAIVSDVTDRHHHHHHHSHNTLTPNDDDDDDNLMYTPSTFPGARFPHLNILKHVDCSKNNTSVQMTSSLDLFGRDDNFIVLFDLENDHAINWIHNQQEQVESYRFIGFAMDDGDNECTKTTLLDDEYVIFEKNDIFNDIYPLLKNFAFIIRPDGHVAWRGVMDDIKKLAGKSSASMFIGNKINKILGHF